MSDSISVSLAIDSGLFEQKSGGYYRPIDAACASLICEWFARQARSWQEIFIIQTNTPDKPALVIGGSEYTLAQFAQKLGKDIDGYKRTQKQDKPLITIEQWATVRGYQTKHITDHPVSIERVETKNKYLKPAVVFTMPSGAQRIQYLGTTRNGDKYRPFWRFPSDWPNDNEGNPKPDGTLWLPSWNHITHDKDTLYICEGEKDALGMALEGYRTIGIPGSQGLTEARAHWLTTLNLKDINHVKCCFDADISGEKGQRKLVRRLMRVFKGGDAK